MTPKTDSPADADDVRDTQTPCSAGDPSTPAEDDTPNLFILRRSSAAETTGLEAQHLSEDLTSTADLTRKAGTQVAGLGNGCQGGIQDSASLFCCCDDSSQRHQLKWLTSFSPDTCCRCQEDMDNNLDNFCFWDMGLEEENDLTAVVDDEQSGEEESLLLKFGPVDAEDRELAEQAGEVVISRAALPRGSVLFEQVLGEVAPEVRALSESCPLTFTVLLGPPSLLQAKYDEDRSNASDDQRHDEEVTTRKKILSWADQKGLPLKSEVYFE